MSTEEIVDVRERIYIENTAPCRGCTERNATCHSNCEKYIVYRRKRDAILEDKVRKDSSVYRSKRKHKMTEEIIKNRKRGFGK